MFFDKNEIIELANGTKHIVVDLLKYENDYFYYVCEVSKDESKVLNDFKIIRTETENGNLFVRTVKGEIFDKILLLFKERLKIK